jgi:hypothetical protein
MKTVSARQLLITFVPPLAILVAIVAVSILFQVSMPTMTQDVSAIAKIHPLSGILSNLGILLWCAAASICFYTATILRNVKPNDTFWFLLSSGLLSAYLLFDDFFQFHEVLASRYLGLDEQVVYAALGIAVSAYLIAFRQIILRTNFGILLSALGFLASSVVIDAILEPWLWRLGHWEYFFEDGAKWLGIASWCSYHVHTSHQFLVSSLGLPNNAIQPDDSTSRHRFPTLERGIHDRNKVA